MSRGKRGAAAAPQPDPITYLDKTDAQVTRERKSVLVDREIDRIYKQYGAVTAERLLAEAKNPSSILHPYFEWNDSEAAHQHRLAQARAMMLASKMVAVLSQQSREPIAAFPEVRRLLPSARGEGKFKMRKEVLDAPDSRHEVIERKLGVLRGWCRETIDIAELQEMRETILARLPESR